MPPAPPQSTSVTTPVNPTAGVPSGPMGPQVPHLDPALVDGQVSEQVAQVAALEAHLRATAHSTRICVSTTPFLICQAATVDWLGHVRVDNSGSWLCDSMVKGSTNWFTCFAAHMQGQQALRLVHRPPPLALHSALRVQH